MLLSGVSLDFSVSQVTSLLKALLDKGRSIPLVDVQGLKAGQLAAVMSSLVASESSQRANIYVGYSCSNAVLEAIETMEPTREWLYRLQLNAGITAGLGVDIRLAGKPSLRYQI